MEPIYTPEHTPALFPTEQLPYDRYAQDTRAVLARVQWDDYKNRYQPIEDMLIGNITGDKRLNDSLDKGSESVNQQYGISEGTFQRNNERYGIGLTPTQTKQHESQMGLSMAATEANMRNSTRREVADSNMGLMSGMSSTKSELM